MDINGLNVMLEKFSFDLKVLNKQLNPRVACVAGACPERVLLEILGEGVPPESLNYDPISDQKIAIFHTRFQAWLLKSITVLRPGLYQ